MVLIEGQIPKRVPLPVYILDIAYVSQLSLVFGPWEWALAKRNVVWQWELERFELHTCGCGRTEWRVRRLLVSIC